MARRLRPALLGFCVLALTACGSEGTSTPLSCASLFDPERAQAGEDCRPRYGTFCPLQPAPFFNPDEPTACDGVDIVQSSLTVAGQAIDYLVMSPKGANANTPTLLALHYSQATGVTLVERMRLAELVKGRGVRVIAPDAPNLTGTWSQSDLLTAVVGDERVAQIDAVLDTVIGAQPVQLLGVSGGAVFAFEYACQRAERVTGLILIVAEIREGELSRCKPQGSFASVQIHGTADLVAPYERVPALSAGVVNVFNRLRANNACSRAVEQGVTLPSPEAPIIPDIDLRWVMDGCRSGQGSALVTINNGGHNIPGNTTALGLPINYFGPISTGFDSTLQGYDLLTYLGG